jgi:hypothetical protein
MDTKIEKFIERLVEATKAKNLSWDKSERKNQFQTKLTSGTVRVEEWTGTDEQTGAEHEMVDLEIFNLKGERVDFYIFSKIEEPGNYQNVKWLHDVARRSYFQVDEFLDQLLGEVEAKKKPRPL